MPFVLLLLRSVWRSSGHPFILPIKNQNHLSLFAFHFQANLYVHTTMGAMAKNNPKRKRPRPASSAADSTVGGGESAWSSIPGHRLTVDIADKQSTGAAVAKEHHESDHDDDSFDDDAFLNTTNWTSQHYEIDDDEAFHKTAETEFWDPDPKAKSNKFDATAKIDGAHDDGMFLR